MDEFDTGRTDKYLAVLAHVHEIVLVGSAELSFWDVRLRDERLVPIDFDGKARILISAIESRYFGLKFRELCIAVVARRDQDHSEQDGLYFAQAFNSSRVFAAVERRFFSTPYLHGQIDVAFSLPASFGLIADSGDSFRAEMSPTTAEHEPLRSGTEGWERAIFLSRNGPGDTGKWFFAKIAGHTRTCAFSPRQDLVSFGPSPREPALRWLIESGFSAQEWSIRQDATHARTKTFTSRRHGPGGIPASGR